MRVCGNCKFYHQIVDRLDTYYGCNNYIQSMDANECKHYEEKTEQSVTKLEREQKPLDPVPLTKEILKTNGFADYNKVMQYCFYEDGIPYSLILRETLNEDWEPDGWGIEIGGILSVIKYVHELQCLLRIVGLNELADNFKKYVVD